MLAKQVQTELAQANSVADEALATMTTVRAHAADDSARAAYAVKLAKFYSLQASLTAHKACTCDLPGHAICSRTGIRAEVCDRAQVSRGVHVCMCIEGCASLPVMTQGTPSAVLEYLSTLVPAFWGVCVHAACHTAATAGSLRPDWHVQRKEAIAYGTYACTNTFLPTAVAAVVLYYGGNLVLQGHMSAGALVSFMLYQQSLTSAFQVHPPPPHPPPAPAPAPSSPRSNKLHLPYRIMHCTAECCCHAASHCTAVTPCSLH